MSIKKRRPTVLQEAVAGDEDDYRLVELGGIDTISGSTWVAHVWLHGQAAVNLVASIEYVGTDADTDPPVIRVELGGAGGWLATTAVGGQEYLIEYEGTLGDGRIWTWPNSAPDRLPVRRSGD